MNVCCWWCLGAGYTLVQNHAFDTGNELYYFICNAGQCQTVYDCATYCKNTQACAGFNYVNGLCQLMSSTANVKAASGVIAGYITQSNLGLPQTPFGACPLPQQ